MTPSRRLLVLAVIVLVIAAVEFGWLLYVEPTPLAGATWAALALLALAAMTDVVWALRSPAPTVQRQMPRNLSQGSWQTVDLVVQTNGTRAIRAELFDAVPGGFDYRHIPRELQLPGRGVTQLRYELRPIERGDAQVGPLHARLYSPLGLWRRGYRLGVPSEVHVFPEFTWLRGALMLVGEQRLQRAGLRLARRRGEGMEFQQLREYRPGDSSRQVDWKASARRPVLISREYQEERDQQILFVLDSGQRMRAKDAGLAHFDQALRALLLLAFVAARQGDAVGLHAFGGSSRRVAMQRGPDAVTALLHAVYDLQPQPAASDYVAVAEELRRRQRRRALIVLLTNVDETDSELPAALGLLRDHHIVLTTSLRETALERPRGAKVVSLEEALLAASIGNALAGRAQVHDALRRAGHRVIDCTPAELPVRLVQDYLDLKRSGRL